MTEPRDDRYRRRYVEERDRAERYRDIALALAAITPGLDLDGVLDADDQAEVARRKRALDNRGRRG